MLASASAAHLANMALAQIEKHDGDLAAVAAQRVVGAATYDGLRQLRREKSLQLADSLDLPLGRKALIKSFSAEIAHPLSPRTQTFPPTLDSALRRLI